LPGALVLYYGDEIGMTDVAVPAELARDTLGGQSLRPGRDRARTPMQWDDSASGGFTAQGIRGWLPSGDVVARNVAAQQQDPGSVLSFCRELLRLRRERAGQPPAGYELLPAPPGVWRYQAGELIVTANLTDGPVGLPESVGKVLLSTAGDRGQADPAALAPWEGVISGQVR
jgi:alpha-glucosidase